jgi:3-phosphoglycerate kinase
MSKTSTTQYSMFYNGVFGKFEDERFENGTKSFIELLKIMTDAGIKTYVGGGEGRLALLKYGSLKDVTHAFTCGGTILKSLTNRNLAFLKAMYLQNTQTLV